MASHDLQVMLYRDMYEAFRRLDRQQIEEYLFTASTSGAGLNPLQPLGDPLLQIVGSTFFPGYSSLQPSAQALGPDSPAGQNHPAEGTIAGPTKPAPSQPRLQSTSPGDAFPLQHQDPSPGSHAAGTPQVPTLSDAVSLLADSLQLLPPSSTAGRLEYMWQGETDPQLVGKPFKVLDIQHDEEWVRSKAAGAVAVWTGKAPALPVGPKEGWKCRFCDFKPLCR